MKYKSFSSFHRGYYHVKGGSECEDYSAHYSDPAGKYYIGVICDGHSDINCFRSNKGAQFGCESTIEVARRFFDSYFEQKDRCVIDDAMEERLKKSIIQSWATKVKDDLINNPITEAEKSPLSQSVRSKYEAGQFLKDIFGATLVAAIITSDFSLVMQIGDGVMMCVDADGLYFSPLEEDEKGNTGAPASMCDDDLFVRKNAFRSHIFLGKDALQAVFVTSDGVGDSMDEFDFREEMKRVIDTLQKDEDNAESDYINEVQQNYVDSFVTHWANEGNGVNDDCSIAAIYCTEQPLAEVKIPRDILYQKWDENIFAWNSVVDEYRGRKTKLVADIERVEVEYRKNPGKGMDTQAFIEAKEKQESLKQTMRIMIRNERNKLNYYEHVFSKIQTYLQRDGANIPDTISLKKPTEVDVYYYEEDKEFVVNNAASEQSEDAVNMKEISQNVPGVNDVSQQDNLDTQDEIANGDSTVWSEETKDSKVQDMMTDSMPESMDDLEDSNQDDGKEIESEDEESGGLVNSFFQRKFSGIVKGGTKKHRDD